MHQGFFASLGAFLASAIVALAQPPVPDVARGADSTSLEVLDPRTISMPWLPTGNSSSQDALLPSRLDQPGFWPREEGVTAPHFWVQGEYLLGWLKDGPSGGLRSQASPFSGLRMTVGGSLDPQQSIRLEGSGFWLEKHTSTFDASPSGFGNSPMHLPFSRR